MTNTTEPEALIVRKTAPYGPPAVALALLVGAFTASWGVGWSAALGVAVVWLNIIASGLSLSRAARVSLTVLYAVAMGGFVVRMAIIVAIMAGLNQLDWFSPLAFALAVVPATLMLLGLEMKLLAGGLGQELQIPPPPSSVRRKVAP